MDIQTTSYALKRMTLLISNASYPVIVDSRHALCAQRSAGGCERLKGEGG
jgi:hypothetical protein